MVNRKTSFSSNSDTKNFLIHLLNLESSGKFNILPPLTSLALFSIMLTGLCGILNLIRLVPYVSEHAVDEQDEQV